MYSNKVGGVKQEPQQQAPRDESDMTAYLKDRVELMRQVFSTLHKRELLAMAPLSLRSLPLDQLQELCLDEVLGISSKRLCSILDGYECPSDTDSDAPDATNIETLSLDSISSAEDDPKHSITKRKKKDKHHKKHRRKTASSSAGSKVNSGSSNKKSGKAQSEEHAGEGSTASMTVLELLELQMRAKAIRAQLQSVQASDNASEGDAEEVAAPGAVADDGDDDDIQIKEEKPEVVEIISSEEEDEGTQIKKEKQSRMSAATAISTTSGASVDPADKQTNIKSTAGNKSQEPPRKIKLNRNNNKLLVSVGEASTNTSDALPSNDLRNLLMRKKGEVDNSINKTSIEECSSQEGRQYRRRNTSEGEEERESPKQNLTRRKDKKKRKKQLRHHKDKSKRKGGECDEDEILLELSDTEKMFESSHSSSGEESDASNTSAEDQTQPKVTDDTTASAENNELSLQEVTGGNGNNETVGGGGGETTHSEDVTAPQGEANEVLAHPNEVVTNATSPQDTTQPPDNISVPASECGLSQEVNLSEGECSQSSSGDVEVMEPPSGADVVCISDGEHQEATLCASLGEESEKDEQQLIEDVEDMILEVSDESTRDSDLCILSKEPSREEILELSKKLEKEIDEETQRIEKEQDDETVTSGNTWKGRWLESDKVKNVLKTSSLFNALRRKNMELRKRLRGDAEEGDGGTAAKDETSDTVSNIDKDNGGAEDHVEDGDTPTDVSSVDYYKTLPSGSKVFSSYEEQQEEEKKKMARDAKQLMKIYKKLVKMNREGGERGDKKKKEGKSKKKKRKNKEKRVEE